MPYTQCSVFTDKGLCSEPVHTSPQSSGEAAELAVVFKKYLPTVEYYGGGICLTHMYAIMSAKVDAELACEAVDFPPVTPGMKIHIQLKEGGYIAQVPNGVPVRPSVMTVHDRDECWPSQRYGDSDEAIVADGIEDEAHKFTICPECIDSWAQDFYITLGDTPASMGLKEAA